MNQYGFVFFSVGINPIHEADRDRQTDYDHRQALFRCIGVTANNHYLLLTSTGNKPFRVLINHFRITAAPPFWMGDDVRVKEAPDKVGVIYRIGWHGKRSEPLFYLRIGTRRSTHRYFAEELEGTAE